MVARRSTPSSLLLATLALIACILAFAPVVRADKEEVSSWSWWSALGTESSRLLRFIFFSTSLHYPPSLHSPGHFSGASP